MTLIQRLEQAAEGSRELDAEIYWAAERKRAEHSYWRGALGLPKPLPADMELPGGLGGASVRVSAPAYTTSLDVALTLSPPNCTRAYGNLNDNDCAWACITPHEEPCPDYTGEAATEALAFCIAALKARDELRARSSDR